MGRVKNPKIAVPLMRLVKTGKGRKIKNRHHEFPLGNVVIFPDRTKQTIERLPRHFVPRSNDKGRKRVFAIFRNMLNSMNNRMILIDFYIFRHFCNDIRYKKKRFFISLYF